MAGLRSGGRYVLYVWGFAFAALLGCTPAEPEDDATPVEAEAVMEMLRNEAVIDVTPSGVEDQGIVELPAEGIADGNWIARTFVAPSDEALLTACAEYHQAALDEGWSGPAPADTNASGIVWTVLSKADMSLGISCTTTQGFDLLESDQDEIRLSARITTSLTSGLRADSGES